MKRTTIYLEESLQRKARQLANKQGVSFATVVREAIAAHVLTPRKASGLPSVTGAFASGLSETAEQAGELLWTDPHK